MIDINIIIGPKEKIPEKYLDQFFALRQLNQEIFQPYIPPSIDYYRNSWTVPIYSWGNLKWAIAVNEEDMVIGYGVIFRNIKYDNLDSAWVGIYVAENQRRKGYGTEILKQLIKTQPDIIKRISTTTIEKTEGESFLKRFNKEPVYTEKLYHADLTDFNIANVEQEAKNQRELVKLKGFEIIYVDNAEFASHVNYPEYIEMSERIDNDMPRENLSDEDIVFSEERYNESYAKGKKYGDRYMTFIAIHSESGKLSGLTTTKINRYQPWIAHQQDTGVLAEFRGNGLGLALKYQMLEKLLKETDSKYWTTGSNHKNIHMIRINRQLKHKDWKNEVVFEFDRKELEKNLSS